MKSFKNYLAESKKTYDFKIKVAGKCPQNFASHIKSALSPYKVESCSSGKGSPIQETQIEFPNLKHVELTVFDVTTSYPATSMQVMNAVAECAGLPLSNIKVRSHAEELENDINNGPEGTSALLGTDYPSENNQEMVGEKHMMGFLKSLSSTAKTTGESVTGTNDAVLAKSAPVDSTGGYAAPKPSKSIVGSKAVKLPHAFTGR